jgi:uncharacterized protein YndB with AHSA1/START domain/DNA-binding transcriptional ArsR family regulator
VDAVFRALADPSRRLLLDALFRADGQTLTELAGRLEMSRFGVMKHLGVLEQAGLITTQRSGRAKLHYLNPVPIRLIHDRWISKYREGLTRALVGLKAKLEGPMEKESLKHVYEVFIRTTPEKLWDAITDGDITRQYFYGSVVKSPSWQAGAAVDWLTPAGEPMINGKIIEIDRPRRLVHSFASVWNPAAAKDKPSRVTWLIEPMGEVCKLTLVHDGFEAETHTYEKVRSGWNPILSGLKTLLETGKPLVIPMQ